MESHPPAVQMVQLLAGFQISQAVYVAAKLGVADHLVDGPANIDDLATALDCDPGALHRLVRTLASLGIFTEAGERTFALTALGETLVSDRPGSMRDLALMWMETHYEPFAGLLGTVRTGRPAALEHYGKPFFEWLSEHPDQVDRFSRAMGNLTDGVKAGAIASYTFPSEGTIVDVGGADGALLAQILTRSAGLRGVVYDLPHVVERVATTVAASDLDGRLSGVGGDFFESVPGGGDLYVLSMVLHDWNDDDACRLLTRICEAGPSGARVIALEPVVPPGDQPHMSKVIDLTMLAMLNGRERTDGEMRDLFTRAGLVFDGVVATPTPISIVEATIP